MEKTKKLDELERIKKENEVAEKAKREAEMKKKDREAVEKAKQELTVNVLRVMMVSPGVQNFFQFHLRITWCRFST